MTESTALLEKDPYARLLGIEMVSKAPVTVGLDITERHLNFHGATHGGVVFSLADTVFALASNQAGDRAVAIDTHLVFTAPSGLGDRLTAVAEEVTRGRTLGTYRITVTRSDGRVVGVFTGTVYIGPPQPKAGESDKI